MKILLIGDPHLKISKFELSKSFLRWIDEVVAQHKPDMVLNLGDTFDTHAVIRSEIMCEFMDHVDRVLAQCPKYTYLLGNHDMYRPNDARYHALLQYKNLIPRFRVIDRLTHDGDISYVPYVWDIANFPKDLRSICFAHQTFVGADYGYYRPDVGVDADKLPCDIIISGHVHKRQSFGKVVYPGTPFAQGLDDIDQIKGVSIFDTTTFKFTFIESPFPQWKGIKIELSQDLDITDAHKIIKSNINSHNNWVVEMTGPRAEIVSYLDSKEWEDMQATTLSLRMKPVYTDKEKVVKTHIKAITVKDIFCEYIDRVYSGSLDKDEIKTYAIQMFDNADKNSV